MDDTTWAAIIHTKEERSTIQEGPDDSEDWSHRNIVIQHASRNEWH